ncbi:MAG TPA: tetratricopeptide repeat protein [Bacillota bacterium]|nr:tetratricopeptide repeat protein [Bacillota bacterium]
MRKTGHPQKTAKTKKELFILEEKQPFSTSRIWELQRQYFDSVGIEAWRQGEVPHYITSNPVMGKTYAEIALAFLRDLARQNKSDDTVYLLELGAGHGRLCYHFLKHFTSCYEQIPEPLPPFCYVLSDFTGKNLEFWQKHPRLQPFLEQGILDLALFDAETSGELQLGHSGTLIQPGSLAQPMLVIGNYFFDTINQEQFFIQDRELSQCLLSLGVETDPASLSPAELLKQLILKYDYQKLEQNPYPEPCLQSLLESYRAEVSGAHILFPHTGIRCLERLRKLSTGGLALLTADKGQHRIEDLGRENAPGLVTHGSFSLSVNYHALKLYCENSGGLALFPRQIHGSLDLGCLLMVPEAESYQETRLAFERFVNQFGPDDFYNILKIIEERIPSFDVQNILSVLRYSGYDARTFSYILPRLHEVLDEVTEDERFSIFQTVHQIWDMYYPLGEKKDLAFELGTILLRLEFYREAVVYYELSGKIYGYTKETLQLLLICYKQLGEDERARGIIEKLKVGE